MKNIFYSYNTASKMWTAVYWNEDKFKKGQPDKDQEIARKNLIKNMRGSTKNGQT